MLKITFNILFAYEIHFILNTIEMLNENRKSLKILHFSVFQERERERERERGRERERERVIIQQFYYQIFSSVLHLLLKLVEH